jgi:hypothetical protein
LQRTIEREMREFTDAECAPSKSLRRTWHHRVK